MEVSPYAELKEQLSSVPARELNISSRLILANNLDVIQVLPSKKGFARDYRGLAELMGFQYYLIKKFSHSENPTMRILDSWETRQDATLDKLIKYLEEMERYDVINEVKSLLEKDAESYASHIRLKETPIQVPEVTSISNIVKTGPLHRNEMDKMMISCDDVNGERTLYDAYVSYADEDCEYVERMADYLENQIGLKLFIHGRDMLAGCAEIDAKIEMIKNRCRHMLIILTPNFLNSPACEFQVSFAGSLAIETKENILIPVIIGDCQIPLILKSVSKIDFTKPYIIDWMWRKLISSLSRDNPLFTLPGELPMPLPLPPTSNKPVITFPQTSQMSTLSIDNASATALAITSGESSENDSENLSPSPKISPPAKKHSFIQFWKKKGHSSRSPPLSFSSGASSGFYSQTRDDLANVSENDVNNNEDDTSL